MILEDGLFVERFLAIFFGTRPIPLAVFHLETRQLVQVDAVLGQSSERPLVLLQRNGFHRFEVLVRRLNVGRRKFHIVRSGIFIIRDRYDDIFR